MMDNKKKSERKPSFPVRQTKTSYKRLLLANPLLEYEQKGINIKEMLKNISAGNGSNIKLPAAGPTSKKPQEKEFKKPRPVLTAPKFVLKNTSVKEKAPPKIKMNNSKVISNVINSTNKTNIKCTTTKSTKNVGIIQKLNLNSAITRKPLQKQPEGKMPIAKPPVQINLSRIKTPASIQSTKILPIRKSLSANHFNKNKTGTVDFKDLISKNTSVDKLSCIPTSTPRKTNVNTPIRKATPVFKTPSAYERRSIKKNTSVSTLIDDSTSEGPSMLSNTTLRNGDIEKKLNTWLQSKGKNVSSFKHLKCFGIHKSISESPENVSENQSEKQEENKENIENLEQSSRSDSYENLLIDTSTAEKVHEIPEVDYEKIAKEALTELLNLILEDLPVTQCIKWLELIRAKNNKIEDTPEYWECRAAIEQSVGNVANATKFYQKAIVHGAEIPVVDKSLDNLLEKLSLLNINQQYEEPTVKNKPRAKIIEEMRNVFKSSIIQFAIHEKKSKNANKNGITNVTVTPVRRSTRVSMSKYSTTPGVTICSSLKTINADVVFKKNKALLS